MVSLHPLSLSAISSSSTTSESPVHSINSLSNYSDLEALKEVGMVEFLAALLSEVRAPGLQHYKLSQSTASVAALLCTSHDQVLYKKFPCRPMEPIAP